MNFQQKLEVLDRCQRGETISSISSALGISESTVRYYHNRCFGRPILRKSAQFDLEATKNFSASLDAIIREGGYTAKQVFNIGETILYWKKLPGRAFISEEESHGFKASQGRLTLLLGANAEGDYRLKPALVYHSENPLGSKGYAKALLPCYWYSNPMAWMTEQISNDYFCEKLHNELECYCKREGIPFKILLVLGNAASHPPRTEVLSDHFRICFIPPNTTSSLQPCNQGIIETFKSYYLRTTVKHLVQEANQENVPVHDCWKAFNINDAIGFIKSAWEEIPRSCLNGVWKKLCPQLVHDFTGPSIEENVASANKETLSKIREAGFTDVYDKDIEDLIEMKQQKEMEGTVSPATTKKMLLTKDLQVALNKIREGLQILVDKDPKVERSLKVAGNVRANIACYEEILEKRNEMSTKKQSPGKREEIKYLGNFYGELWSRHPSQQHELEGNEVKNIMTDSENL